MEKIISNKLTITIPQDIDNKLNTYKKELGSSKNEIITIALKKFFKEKEKDKLINAVNIMQDEYKNNKELIEFTTLDSEDFIWNKKRFGLLI